MSEFVSIVNEPIENSIGWIERTRAES